MFLELFENNKVILKCDAYKDNALFFCNRYGFELCLGYICLSFYFWHVLPFLIAIFVLANNMKNLSHATDFQQQVYFALRRSSLADRNRFSFRICLYLAPSMLPFMATTFSGPPAEKQLQSMHDAITTVPDGVKGRYLGVGLDLICTKYKAVLLNQMAQNAPYSLAKL